MSRRKKAGDQPHIVTFTIYGIWSKTDERLIFISLNREDVEFEYDMEGYSTPIHVIVKLFIAYDISSLEV